MELDKGNLEVLNSLVDSYARLTTVPYPGDLGDSGVMLKHGEAREKVLDEIIKLLG